MSYSKVDVLPPFMQPGQYIRYYGLNVGDPVRDNANKLRFIRLLDKEGPLIFPFKMKSSSVAIDALSGVTNFSDLDPSYTHIYQLYLGVQPGFSALVSHPFDQRILKWDVNVSQISEDVTAVVTQSLSAYSAPSFELWVAPGKRYPALDSRNRSQEHIPGGKSIIPQVIFIGTRFRYQLVDPAAEADIYDMLVKFKIPSRPISFGGTLREAVR